MGESFCTLLSECSPSESALARYFPLHHRGFRLRGLDTKMLSEHIGSSGSPHTVQRRSWSERVPPLCPSRDKVLTFLPCNPLHLVVTLLSHRRCNYVYSCHL